MKKISLLTLGLFLIFGLSGCGKADKNLQGDSENKVTEVKNQEANDVQENMATNGASMVDKLKNAISSGKKMKCTYKMTDENGSTEVITYMQGDKYKSEINMGGMKTASVFDGDTMYSWVSGQKTGTKMTMDCINGLDVKGETETEAMPENVPESEDDFVDTLNNAENLKCEDAADIDFTVPGDVNFVDQCEMLKSQQKMIEGLNK